MYSDGCIRIPAEIVEAARRRRIADPLAASDQEIDRLKATWTAPRSWERVDRLSSSLAPIEREPSNFIAAAPGA